MYKRKLTRESLAELAKRMPVLSEEVQSTFIGGGDGTFSNPYTFEEYSKVIASVVFSNNPLWKRKMIIFASSKLLSL